MDQILINPSITMKKKWGELKAYNIDTLYGLAFAGGIIPSIIYSVLNAKWLRTNQKSVRIILLAGISLFIIEIVTCHFIIKGLLDFNMAVLFGLSRCAAVVYFGFCRRLMMERYRLIQLVGGKIIGTYIHICIWAIAGTILEMLFAVIGGTIG